MTTDRPDPPCPHGAGPDIVCAECAREEAAYEAAWEEYIAGVCPQVRSLDSSYDDPMSCGASDVIDAAIDRHMRTCAHAWCVAEREA